MGAGVATVGRRRYAVGLYWQPTSSNRVAAAARDAAKQPGQFADLYAVRSGERGGRMAQFGLGLKQAGHKMGMPTLAATLANRLPGSWAGAFKLSEGTVVIVVRDDLIAPDGDQIYIDDAEARDRLVAEVHLGGLQKVYAPEAWSIPSAETIALPFVLQNKADCSLKLVRVPIKILLSTISTIALIGAGVGGFWYYSYIKEQEEAIRIEQIRIENEKKAANERSTIGQNNIVYPPPKRFWEDEPKPMDIVTACQAAMEKSDLEVQGWDRKTLSCNKDGVQISWQRRQEAYTKPIEGASIDDTAVNSSKSIPVEGLKKRAGENLLDPTEITRRYLMQNWQATLTRLPDDPPPPCPPNVPPEQWNPPPAPWVKRGFNITLTDLPGELPQYFKDISGVIINNMTYQGNSWTVEGVIYENRR